MDEILLKILKTTSNFLNKTLIELLQDVRCNNFSEYLS